MELLDLECARSSETPRWIQFPGPGPLYDYCVSLPNMPDPLVNKDCSPFRRFSDVLYVRERRYVIMCACICLRYLLNAF